MAGGISAREFARREGVSDTLVWTSIKQDIPMAYANKSLNPRRRETRRREGGIPGANSSANTGANTPCEQGCEHPR